jgi:hypothetical protein
MFICFFTSVRCSGLLEGDSGTSGESGNACDDDLRIRTGSRSGAHGFV